MRGWGGGGEGSEFTRGHDHLSCVPPQSSFMPPTTRNGSRSGGKQTRGCFRQRQRRELRPNTRGDNRRAADKSHLQFISMAFFGGVYLTINMNTFIEALFNYLYTKRNGSKYPTLLSPLNACSSRNPPTSVVPPTAVVAQKP